MVALIIFIFLVLGSIKLYNSSLFDIEKISVKGNSKIMESRIVEIAKIKPGISLLRISSREIKRNIKGEPWIEDISIIKHYPHRLEVKVTERKPLGIIVLNNSQYLVDRNQFVWRSEDKDYDLPLIKDIDINLKSDSGRAESPQLKNAILCLSNLEENIKKLLLTVSAPSVEGLNLYLNGEILILYGKATETKKKNYLLGLILSQARLKGERLESIDVRVPSHPVVKKQILPAGG